ncbi:hypothetical protein D3C76_348680 [compost metagenome]
MDGNGSKLHSVNSSGKPNWAVTVPEADKLTVMNDGTIILINPSKRDAKGIFSPWAYAYSATGKKLAERALSNTYDVLDGQYLLSQIGDSTNAKIEAYGTKLNKLFTYTPPKGAYLDVSEASWVINKSELLIRMDLPKTGNRLIALDSKGKTLWGRNIAGNASVQSTGQNYVVYENEEIKVYGATGLILKKPMKLIDPMHLILKTPDTKMMIYEEEYKSVIDPATLKTIYNIPYDNDKTSVEYYYAGEGYLYAVKDHYKLFQYKLPSEK